MRISPNRSPSAMESTSQQSIQAAQRQIGECVARANIHMLARLAWCQVDTYTTTQDSLRIRRPAHALSFECCRRTLSFHTQFPLDSLARPLWSRRPQRRDASGSECAQAAISHTHATSLWINSAYVFASNTSIICFTIAYLLTCCISDARSTPPPPHTRAHSRLHDSTGTNPFWRAASCSHHVDLSFRNFPPRP